MTDEPIAEIGDNIPPEDTSVDAALIERRNELVKTGTAWLEEAGPGAGWDEERAAKAVDFRDQLRKHATAIEESRTTLVGPFNATVREINGEHKAVAAPLDATLKLFEPRMREHLKAKRAKEEAEARRLREEAAAAEAEAQTQAGDATVGDLLAAQTSAQQAKDADKAASQAERAPGTTKGEHAAKAATLRGLRKAKVIEPDKALWHYRHSADVRELVFRLANAEIRAAYSKGKTPAQGWAIPGVEIVMEERAI